MITLGHIDIARALMDGPRTRTEIAKAVPEDEAKRVSRRLELLERKGAVYRTEGKRYRLTLAGRQLVEFEDKAEQSPGNGGPKFELASPDEAGEENAEATEEEQVVDAALPKDLDCKVVIEALQQNAATAQAALDAYVASVLRGELYDRLLRSRDLAVEALDMAKAKPWR